MKDLFDTLLADSTPDPDTCRALAGYLRRQADRLEYHAENLDEAVAVARSLHSAIRRHKRAPPPPPKPQVHERNQRIVQAAERGWTNAALARKYKLSTGYVGRIVKAGFTSGRETGAEADNR